MQIHELKCPRCDSAVVVSARLFEVGTVRVRCPSCALYFLPEGSPHSTSVIVATNASVPITIFEPEGADR